MWEAIRIQVEESSPGAAAANTGRTLKRSENVWKNVIIIKQGLAGGAGFI